MSTPAPNMSLSGSTSVAFGAPQASTNTGNPMASTPTPFGATAQGTTSTMHGTTPPNMPFPVNPLVQRRSPLSLVQPRARLLGVPETQAKRKMFDSTQGAPQITATPFASFLTSPTINIKFPHSNREYHLHETVLASKSDYFKHMLSSGMREQQNRSVTFNWTLQFEITFRLVIQYLYTGTYHIDPVIPNPLSKNSSLNFVGTQEQAAQHDHIHLYVLADRLLMPDLKSIALARVMEVSFPPILPSVLSVPTLAKVLYDDAIDCPEEGSSDEGQEQEQEQEQSTKDDRDVGKESAPEIGQPFSFSFSCPVKKQIKGMKDDPRREMQKVFAELVHKSLKTTRNDPGMKKLIFEGGPFVLDLFLLDANSS